MAPKEYFIIFPPLLPLAMISTERRLCAFRHRTQLRHPLWVSGETLWIGFAAINSRPPYARDLADIGWAALAPFDFYRGNIGGEQLRQQFQRVQTGWLFQRVIFRAIDHITAFAQCRVTGIFTGVIAVDKHIIEP